MSATARPGRGDRAVIILGLLVLLATTVGVLLLFRVRPVPPAVAAAADRPGPAPVAARPDPAAQKIEELQTQIQRLIELTAEKEARIKVLEEQPVGRREVPPDAAEPVRRPRPVGSLPIRTDDGDDDRTEIGRIARGGPLPPTPTPPTSAPDPRPTEPTAEQDELIRFILAGGYRKVPYLLRDRSFAPDLTAIGELLPAALGKVADGGATHEQVTAFDDRVAAVRERLGKAIERPGCRPGDAAAAREYLDQLDRARAFLLDPVGAVWPRSLAGSGPGPGDKPTPLRFIVAGEFRAARPVAVQHVSLEPVVRRLDALILTALVQIGQSGTVSYATRRDIDAQIKTIRSTVLRLANGKELHFAREAAPAFDYLTQLEGNANRLFNDPRNALTAVPEYRLPATRLRTPVYEVEGSHSTGDLRQVERTEVRPVPGARQETRTESWWEYEY